MSQHRLQKRQSLSADGISGSIVVSDPTPTATALAQDTAVSPNSVSLTGIPLATFASISSLTSSSSPSAATTTSSSSPSGNDISLSTVIGACIGAFSLLILVIYLAIYCSKRQKSQVSENASPASRFRNTANNISRRRSHFEPWGLLKDVDDGKNDSVLMQRPPSGPIEKLGAMFHRTPSIISGEKSSDAHGNRESISTMQHFAKYHPGLAEQMASKPSDAGYIVLTKPLAVQKLGGRIQTDSISTNPGDSYLSMHSHLYGNISPTMTVAKFTPPATVSGSHHWESAEVRHMQDNSETGDLRHPFVDGAASVKSSISRRVTNPFFNAQDTPKKRTLPVNITPPHEAADSNIDVTSSILAEITSGVRSNNPHTLESLIAALETPTEEVRRLRVASMRSSHYSCSSMSGDEAEDAVSVTAFPYPPPLVSL